MNSILSLNNEIRMKNEELLVFEDEVKILKSKYDKL